MPPHTTAEGVNIAYERVGAGPPLVLVHGITESRRTWDPLVAELARTNTVIAADLRGHGESSGGPSYDLGSFATDVRSLVNALGVEDPALIGHSLGGTVVTAYASAFPCRAVVNIDQPLALAAFQDGLRQLEPMLRGDRSTFEAAITMVFDSMSGELVGPARERVEALRRPDQDVVLAIWTPVLESTADELDGLVRQMTGGVRAPYLSLHGIDPGPDYGAWLGTLIPTATVEVWPGLGHYPHLVAPERFAARVQEFLSPQR